MKFTKFFAFLDHRGLRPLKLILADASKPEIESWVKYVRQCFLVECFAQSPPSAAKAPTPANSPTFGGGGMHDKFAALNLDVEENIESLELPKLIHQDAFVQVDEDKEKLSYEYDCPYCHESTCFSS